MGGNKGKKEMSDQIGLPRVPLVAQWVKLPTLAQLMISGFLGSSPMSGSVLTPQSLKTASHAVALSLSVSLPDSFSPPLCLSPSKKIENRQYPQDAICSQEKGKQKWKFRMKS